MGGAALRFGLRLEIIFKNFAALFVGNGFFNAFGGFGNAFVVLFGLQLYFIIQAAFLLYGG